MYVHNLGQTDATLSFNIIRVGDITEDLTIGWRLVGDGGSPVEGADFVGGTLLSKGLSHCSGST